MDDKTKNKILNPFNLLAFALAILSLLFLHNGPHIYVMIMVIVACTVKFVSMDRVWTGFIAFMITIAVSFPLVTTLNGEYIYLLLVGAALANIIPMVWFMVKNQPSILYK